MDILILNLQQKQKIILDNIQETYDKVYDFISQAKKGTLKLSRGLSAEEALEAYIVNELSKARDKAGNTADNPLMKLMLEESWRPLVLEVLL